MDEDELTLYYKRLTEVSILKLKLKNTSISVKENLDAKEKLSLLSHLNKQFAKKLVILFRKFVEENKNLYENFSTPYFAEILTIELRKKKKAIAVTGRWYGRYGYISDSITYLIPIELITDSEKYKITRTEYIRNYNIRERQQWIKDTEKEIIEDTRQALENIAKWKAEVEEMGIEKYNA